jgi:hypothetical protein
MQGMPAPAAGDDIALIAGIVGGAIGLLIIVGVIAAVVLARRRRRGEPNETPMTPTSSYGKVPAAGAGYI